MPSTGGEFLKKLDVAFVLANGKPLVESYLKIHKLEKLGIHRGDLEHYAAALKSMLTTPEEGVVPQECIDLIELTERSYPNLSMFREWVSGLPYIQSSGR